MVGPADYWRYLTRTIGFVAPVERAIIATAGIEPLMPTSRFHKHELLRRDLLGFRMRTDEIDSLPQCVVPAFERPEDAIGWAYPIERSTLAHANLYRHLALVMPGDVAFTSSYLKCYLGTSGEAWRSFALALDQIADPQRVVEAARAAFRAYREWRHDHSRLMDRSSSDSGDHRFA